MICNFASFLDEEGRLSPGLLDYLADGVLPLLHIYYLDFFDPLSTKKSSKENEITVSAMIARSLVVIH